jgi:hypothetical protein
MSYLHRIFQHKDTGVQLRVMKEEDGYYIVRQIGINVSKVNKKFILTDDWNVLQPAKL